MSRRCRRRLGGPCWRADVGRAHGLTEAPTRWFSCALVQGGVPLKTKFVLLLAGVVAASSLLFTGLATAGTAARTTVTIKARTATSKARSRARSPIASGTVSCGSSCRTAPTARSSERATRIPRSSRAMWACGRWGTPAFATGSSSRGPGGRRGAGAAAAGCSNTWTAFPSRPRNLLRCAGEDSEPPTRCLEGPRRTTPRSDRHPTVPRERIAATRPTDGPGASFGAQSAPGRVAHESEVSLWPVDVPSDHSLALSAERVQTTVRSST